MAKKTPMGQERTDPESLEEQKSVALGSAHSDFVSVLSSTIVQAKADRAFWEQQVDRYMALRYGWRTPKTFPWKNCANYMMPLIDTDISRVKPAYVNLVNVTPMVAFEPYGPEDLEPARKREYLFDWRMRTQVNYFPQYVMGVDMMLIQGAVVFKTNWKFATSRYYKKIDLADLPMNVLEALYDPRMDDAMLYKIVVEEFQIDDSLVENEEQVNKVIKDFREGKTSFEMKLLEITDDRAELTACSIRDDITFPVDTCNLNDARFIDYTFTRSQNDILIAMRDGRYESYPDDVVASWAGSVPANKLQARTVKAGANKKDELIWLHETCVWFDIDDDGIEERCIVTWPEASPSTPLRFIELPYDHGQWPYVLVKREFNGPGAFESRGYGSLGEDFQNAITAFVNQSVDNGTIVNTPRTKYKRGSIANIRNIRYVPGEALEVLTSLEDVKVEQGGNSSQAFLFQSAQYFKSWADQRTGNIAAGLTAPVNTAGTGSQGSKTAKEIGLVEQIGSEVQSLELQVFQNQMANVYYQIDSLYEQFGSEKEEILITGEQPVSISREEIQGRFNIVPNGKLDNSNPQFRAAKAFNLMSIFNGDPMINQRELREYYLVESDVRLAKVLLKSEQQIAQEAQAAQAAQDRAKAESVRTQLGLKVAADNLDVRKAAMMVPFEGKKYAAG